MELVKLKIKIFLLKVLSFLKLYGLQILFGAAFVFALFAVKDKEKVINTLLNEQAKSKKEHEDNLLQLQQEVTKEIVKRQEIEKQYTDIMNIIRTEHDAGIQKIAEEKSKEIRAIIQRNQSNPEAATTAINNLFGIPVIVMKEVP